MQLEGIFDVAPSQRSEERWQGEIDLPDDWNIGVIVGPSGSGKTTLAHELFPDFIVNCYDWPDSKSIVDAFPDGLSIKDITGYLSSVGFSSPPSWLRPFRVLSNGEQFRATLARALADERELIVIDEFTSVVDRTVAQIGSAALSKAIRRKGKKFIAVSVHYDILDWLEPDWVYQPHTGEYYTGRYLHRRPEIKLKVKRVHHSAWRIFRQYHYLDTGLNTAAVCFCAFYDGRPVAFTAALHFPHPKAKNIKREHRTVCLPDFQGVGIGNALSDYVGAMFKTVGYRWQSQTSNPAMIHARNRSKNWAMIARPNRKSKTMPKQSFSGKRKGTSGPGAGRTGGLTKRLRATFEYVGSALDKQEAIKIMSD